MDKLKKFEIAFGGLSYGIHQFDFDVDNSFFERFENEIIQGGNLHAKVTLTKQSQILKFDFDIRGTIHVECDRCCDEFELPVLINEQMLVKFGDEAKEEDIDVFVIPVSETHINIAQQLYEYIAVSKPMHVVHPDNAKGESTCNPEILKKLNHINDETKEIKEKTADQRWDVLKYFKN
ncbi:MAG: DUF177 domain-containing protein [Bacteroidia bacterium]